jgi:small subunit ribosomal protein S3
LKIEYIKNSIFIHLCIPEANLILDKNSEKLEELFKKLQELVNDEKIKINIKLINIKNPYFYAQSISNLIKGQLEKRLRFRQVFKNILKKIIEEKELRGMKVLLSGRLDGSTIARRESINYGKMPLSTIDSNIEEGKAEALMTYGLIGIKVLVYKGRK